MNFLSGRERTRKWEVVIILKNKYFTGWAYWLIITNVLLLFGSLSVVPNQLLARRYFGSGYSSVGITDLKGQNSSRLEFKDGRQYSLSWGGKVQSLRAQYSLEGLSARIPRVHSRSGTRYSVDAIFESTRISLAFFGNEPLPLQVPVKGGWFWGLGVGASRYSVKDLNVPGEIRINSSDISLIAHSTVGMNIRLNPNHHVSFKYRYLTSESLSFQNEVKNRNYQFGSVKESAVGLQYRWFY